MVSTQETKNIMTKIDTFAMVGVAAHLRGMRPTPSTMKDTLMLSEKLKL